MIGGLTDDLGEHERTDRQLRRYMDYFALGQSGVGTWAWNCSSMELSWSREHFQVFGLDPSRHSVSYRSFFQMLHPDERARVEQELQEAARSECDFDSEYRIIRPDGVLVPIHSRAHPVFGSSGELTEYVGTVMDITDRRRAEESLGRMQAELAHASRAITLGQLMASIAHQVNQPLAALVANANAALRWLDWKQPRIDNARQALSRIVRDGNRVSDIITRIRALVGNAAARRSPLSLNAVVREVMVLLKPELRRNNITVRIDLAERLPLVRGDRVQMQQVLLNLAMNAMESMTPIVTRRRLLAIVTTADVASVAVSVEDCGVGLEEGSLERIFEPFYSTKPQGMGIGLAISRSIVEAHGGRLWATCNSECGATFEFRLPLARVAGL